MAYKDIEKRRAYHKEKQRQRRANPEKNATTNSQRRKRAADPIQKEKIKLGNQKWRDQKTASGLTKSVEWQRERRKARPADYLLFDAKRRAARKKVPYEISAAEQERIAKVIRSGHCEVTGLPFASLNGKGNPWAPSLDRCKPELGYVDGNIRVVVWALNMAKGPWGDEVLLKLAHAIVDTPATNSV